MISLPSAASSSRLVNAYNNPLPSTHGFFWQAPELTESTLMEWFDRW